MSQPQTEGGSFVADGIKLSYFTASYSMVLYLFQLFLACLLNRAATMAIRQVFRTGQPSSVQIIGHSVSESITNGTKIFLHILNYGNVSSVQLRPRFGTQRDGRRSFLDFLR